MDEGSIRLGVDIGGTFTDVVLFADGELTTAKVPTTADRSAGVVAGIKRVCETAGIEPDRIDSFRHATTVATNALLESDGAQTALLTTEGFADVLEIGRQNRPSLYDLTERPPEPLVPSERRYELAERATQSGIETALDDAELSELIDDLDDETESVAVSFLHAYASPENERKAVSMLREKTDLHVVGSHEILPEFREYERTATTVADAFVTPILGRYLARLEAKASERALPKPQIMQSNGGIATAEQIREHAVTTALSGPAAGVVGASLFEDGGVVSFDMGGTSTDVGLIREGEIERTTDADVGGHPVRVPMVAVETVGAGGGSVAWVDEGGALRVGPRSAGAEPGPACYGKGGDRPAVTDANLQLGYLGADTTLGENLQLQADPARRTLSDLADEAGLDGPTAAARGVYRIATERMSQAVRTVTVREGHDPRSFALVAFGGAGPMHAGALAAGLGIDRIRIPLANGVLSALGLLAAAEQQDDSRTIRESLAAVGADRLDAAFAELERNVSAALTEPAAATITRTADLRYEGQSHELTVELGESVSDEDIAERFHATHERIRGYRLADEPVELVTIRATGTVPTDEPDITHEGTETRSETRQAYFDGGFRSTAVYEREALPVGTELTGPAIFEGGESTVVVPPAWTAQVDQRGTLEVRR
ncbi:hydantoinase/oxoprolinase family protein [Halovenus sp. HT40]|uniref:hydantoinase/oxoprolinase family protein n=1 Tax=Halovenus sp. HT40 TaxID=3126691 RepID=UPI00300EE44A